MADVAPAGLSPAHPAVGPLGPLLERLHREDLLAVGADRAARAEELLQRLAAAGISLMTADAAADWLAPVLCRSEREQRALRERLRADAPARADAVESTSRPGPPPATGISATALVPDRPSRNRARFWRLLALAVVAAVVLAILSVAIMAPRSPVVPKAPLDAPGMFDPRLGLLLPWAAGIAVALLLGHRDFVRLRAGLPPAPRAPQPGGDVLPLLPEGRLRTAMRGLSRRIAPGGTLLDLPRTLAATVRNAGVPTLAYGGRPLLPRYVLLADMAGSADSQRLPAEALRRRMTEAGLEVSAFAFQRSPGALRPWGGARRGIRLARMASRQRGARLLVSSDAAGLRGNEAGLADFPERILLTPRPPSAWGVREAALIADGWQVVTMDGTGVARIAAWLSGPRDPAPLPPPRQAGSSTVDLPTVLERDPTLNDPFHAPPADVLARLLKRLRDDLGAAGYQLLATLAAGPDASAPMVEQIAAHLGAQGVTLPDAAKSALLLRVPWLRRGALPGWLRAALVESMLPEWHEPARVAWLLHQSGQSVALPASPARRLVLPERETARLARLVANSLGNDGDPLLLQMVRGGAMARAMPWALSWRTSLSYALVVGTLLAGVQQGVERYGGALWKELLYAVAQQIRSALLVGLQVAALALMAVCLRWPRGAALPTLLSIPAALILVVVGAAAGAPVEVALATALLGACGLGWLRETSVPPPAPRSLLARGHPWLNIGALLGLAALSALAVSLPNPAAIDDLLLNELGNLLVACAIALCTAMRVRIAGALPARTAWRAAARFVLGQMLAGGLMSAVSGLASIRNHELGQFDARMLGGLAFALLPFVADVRRRGLAWLTLPLTVGLSALAPVWLLLGLAALVPWRLGLVLLSAAGPSWRQLWRLALWSRAPLAPVLIGAALNYEAVLDDYASVVQSAATLEYALLWTAARRVHPALAVASGDGLWWRCLLLMPCWVGYDFGVFRIGPYTELAIPLAAWLAARYGKRALPAIALSVLPMAAGYYVGPLSVGGDPGNLLAAMLIARFAADAAFRQACLSAADLGRREIAALLLLPVAIYLPSFSGLALSAGGGWVPWAVVALVALSGARAAAPIGAVLVSIAVGFAYAAVVVLGSVHIGTATWRLGPSNPLGAVVTLGLLYAGLRGLRSPAALVLPGTPDAKMDDAASKHPTRRELVVSPESTMDKLVAATTGLLRRQPTACALVVIALAMLVSFYSPIGFSPDPFSRLHIWILALVFGAAGWLPAWAPRRGRLAAWPWMLVPAALVAAVFCTLPASRFAWGPFKVYAFSNTIGDAVELLVAITLFHRMGVGLRRWLAEPDGVARLQPKSAEAPVFRTLPVRLALLMSGAALLAFVGQLVVDFAVNLL